MKVRLLFAAVLANAFLIAAAQDGKFGYIDFNSTLKLMPEYLEAEINLQKMQSDYKEELDRSKREFERNYIEFMLEQDQLSPSIVAKRQRELQLLMDNNAQFRDKVQSDLETKRSELLSPIKNKLLKTVADICMEQDLDYVVDTGKGTYLFINQDRGVDISVQVHKRLGIDNQSEQIAEGEQAVIVSSQANQDNK
jgi:outer membrane protein